MRPRHGSVVVFTGAPESLHLDWEDKGLINSFIPVFIRYLGGCQSKNGSETEVAASSTEWPKWRSVRASSEGVRGKSSVRHASVAYVQRDQDVFEDLGHADHGTPFLSTAYLQSVSSEDPGGSLLNSSIIMEGSGALSQFLEHSLAVYDDLQSSQVIDPTRSTYRVALGHNTTTDATFLTETGFVSTISQDESFSSVLFPASKRMKTANSNNIPSNISICDLKAIPNATYLTSIIPQTLTVNIIAGIISIAPARTVKLRRTGYEMNIVEMLVGDDTKSGFSITFWLQPAPIQTSHTSNFANDDIRIALEKLRSQDVVLVREVALSSFRGQVFGQSLNKRMTRSSTKLDMLWRGSLDAEDILGFHGPLTSSDCTKQVTEKTTRVKEWVLRFIGRGPKGAEGRSNGDRNGFHAPLQGPLTSRDESLPLDTQ